jgi:hypothetical protein
MSIGHDNSLNSTVGHVPAPPVLSSADQKPLHRLAKVRRREAISVRIAARHLRIPSRTPSQYIALNVPSDVGGQRSV